MMMIMRVRSFLMLVILVGLSGCASTVAGSLQSPETTGSIGTLSKKTPTKKIRKILNPSQIATVIKGLRTSVKNVLKDTK